MRFYTALEVSLDCCVCRRCWRTVALGPDGGHCSSNHPFPGRVVGQTPSADGIRYELAWELEPFVDAKYPEARVPDGRVNWARVNFDITCGECGQTQSDSVQQNLGDHAQDCGCGALLYHWRQDGMRLV